MIDFNFPILKEKFKKHKALKKKLLTAIDEAAGDTIHNRNDYYSDTITKLDWSKRKITDRNWVQKIVKDLMIHFEKEVNKIGLKTVSIYDLWFQQYTKGDTHGWHVHGQNFTGVYYLELNKKAPRTELIEPINKNKITVEAEEGDIIIFPSVYIHRAPVNNSKSRKTIISFNFSVEFLEDKYLKKLKELYG